MKTNKPVRFCRLAGSRQPFVENAADLAAAVKLDPAHWAVIGMPLDTVTFNPEFLASVDSDHNGRIRPDEFRRAAEWMLSLLSDWSGIDKKSDVLDLNAVNTENPEGARIVASAKLILENLGLSGEHSITLDQVMNRKNLILNSCGNGDGVITDQTDDAELAQYIRDAMAACGSVKDLSGLNGSNAELIGKFHAALQSFKAWSDSGKAPEISPCGEKTDALYTLFAANADVLNEFFEICETMALCGAKAPAADPMDRNAMAAFYDSAPCAKLNPEGVLDLNGWINPRRGTGLAALASAAKEAGLAESKERLTQAEWKKMTVLFAARKAWLGGKPELPAVMPNAEKTEQYLQNKLFERAGKLIESDAAVRLEIESYDLLKRLIIYQHCMLEFSNDFLNLSRFFNPFQKSLIQPGYVLMDGRHFGLTARVTDMATHKKIMLESNICVMYLDLSTGTLPNVRKMQLAAAITSGTMRNIFVGRTGVFIGSDGTEWDAKVIDIIQHPVSISEALQTPFYRLGEFMGKQADKFFSSKSKEMEDKAGADLSAGKLPTKVAEQTAAKQTPAVSGSMMLMGGGVGLAALGSAFAFIANSLKSISVWNILGVFIIIAVVLSAPMMFVSFIKLMSRKVSAFLAASGWAINPKMRLSRKMGIIFTHAPGLPEHITLVHDDPLTKIAALYVPVRKTPLWFIILAVILLLLAGLLFYVLNYTGWNPFCFMNCGTANN